MLLYTCGKVIDRFADITALTCKLSCKEYVDGACQGYNGSFTPNMLPILKQEKLV